MRVVPYDPKYKQDFIEMNMAWITQMFKMEAEDLCEMENIEPALERADIAFEMKLQEIKNAGNRT